MADRSHQNCSSRDSSSQAVQPKVYSSSTECAAPPHFTWCPAWSLTQPAFVAKVLPLQPGGKRIVSREPALRLDATRQLGPSTKFQRPFSSSFVESAAQTSVGFSETAANSMWLLASELASLSHGSEPCGGSGGADPVPGPCC